MRLDVLVDHAAVTKQFDEWGKQSKFALTLALNRTANDVQAGVRQNVQDRFILRRPAFILNTVKIAPEDRANARANKFEAAVRIDETRDYLAKFEEGGVKEPRSSRSIAIPVNARRTKSDVIARSQFPRALLSSRQAARGRVFIKGNLILQIVGRAKTAVTKLLYILRPSVRIPKRLGMVDTATRVIEERWHARAAEAVEQTMRTAR